MPLIEDKTVFSTVSSTDRSQFVQPDPSTTHSISKSICFILKSSTRLDLLRNVLKFLDQIFECDRAADLVSALMHIWVVEYDLLDGLLECWKVIHDEKEDIVAIDSWIHVVYLICQTCDMETRRSDRSSVSLKVGIIGVLPKKSNAVLTAVGKFLRRLHLFLSTTEFAILLRTLILQGWMSDVCMVDIPVPFSQWDNFSTLRARGLGFFVGPYYVNLL